MKVKQESEKAGLKLNIHKTQTMASGPITPWQIDGETMERVTLFSWAPELQVATAVLKSKDACSLEEKLWPPRQHIKKQRHCFNDKGPSRQSCSFSRSHVWMWELDHKESWAPKYWCFWTVVLERTLESPLDNKEIKPVILKEISPEYSLEGLMLKLKLQYFGHLVEKNWLIGNDTVLGKDWRQEEKGSIEDEMVGWHHWLDGYEFGQILGVGDGWGSLAGCSPWALKESEMTDQLNWTVTEWICTDYFSFKWVGSLPNWRVWFATSILILIIISWSTSAYEALRSDHDVQWQAEIFPKGRAFFFFSFLLAITGHPLSVEEMAKD